MIVLSLVWSVLCIILFFKVWRMTDDIKAIRELMQGKDEKKVSPVANMENQEDGTEAKTEEKAEQEKSGFDTTPLIWIASALLAMAILYTIYFSPK